MVFLRGILVADDLISDLAAGNVLDIPLMATKRLLAKKVASREEAETVSWLIKEGKLLLQQVQEISKQLDACHEHNNHYNGKQ